MKLAVCFLIIVLFIVACLWAQKQRRKKLLRVRIAKHLENLRQEEAQALYQLLENEGWNPSFFNKVIIEMEENKLLSHHQNNRLNEKKIWVYELTDLGKDSLLPKPKAEIPAETQTFAAEEFQKK
jgi:predicted transcriptional regulator